MYTFLLKEFVCFSRKLTILQVFRSQDWGFSHMNLTARVADHSTKDPTGFPLGECTGHLQSLKANNE
jgi:hypothetical protein